MIEEWIVGVNHPKVSGTSQLVELARPTLKEFVARAGAFN